MQVEAEQPEIALLRAYFPDVCIVERANETFIAHADLEAFGSSSEIWEAVLDLLAEVCSVVRTERAGFRWINLGTKLRQRKSDGSVLVHHRIALEAARFALIGGNVNMSAGGALARLPRQERTRCLMKTNPAVKQAVDFLAQPSTFGSLWNAFETIMKSNGLDASQYRKLGGAKGSGSCLRADADEAESFYKTAHRRHRHPPKPRHPKETWKVMLLGQAEIFVRSLFYQWIDSLEDAGAGEP